MRQTGGANEPTGKRLSGETLVEELGNLMQGFSTALTGYNIMLMFAGVVLGVIVGVLPGLGGANGIAILLPLSYLYFKRAESYFADVI